MYNGIGLTTPRGSGTSGHVVRNASALKSERKHDTAHTKGHQYPGERSSKHKHVDKEILEHEQKRQIEVKCLELQDELEEKGLDDDEIEQRVNRFRRQLLENIDYLDLSKGRKIRSFEIQKLAAAKSKENNRMATALRVDDDYVEGAAFDRELQELRRQKHLLERERERVSRAEKDSSSYRHSGRHRSSQSHHNKTKRTAESRDSSVGSEDRFKGDDSRDTEQHRSSRRHGHRCRGRSSSPSDSEKVTHRTHNQSPPNDRIKTVEGGEPGEIEDIDGDDSGATHSVRADDL
ncbi:RNA-splicing factor [Coemansia sp. Benny D160-2]|nr:RNA-splicing factor [Coemansia sp. Benny D160-2]